MIVFYPSISFSDLCLATTMFTLLADLDREVAVIEEDLYQKYAASCNPSNFLILPGEVAVFLLLRGGQG